MHGATLPCDRHATPMHLHECHNVMRCTDAIARQRMAIAWHSVVIPLSWHGKRAPTHGKRMTLIWHPLPCRCHAHCTVVESAAMSCPYHVNSPLTFTLILNRTRTPTWTTVSRVWVVGGGGAGRGSGGGGGEGRGRCICNKLITKYARCSVVRYNMLLRATASEEEIVTHARSHACLRSSLLADLVTREHVVLLTEAWRKDVHLSIPCLAQKDRDVHRAPPYAHHPSDTASSRGK